MNRSLTIVMYHYVRDIAHSRYPEIKGLSTAHFEEQIAYIKKHYTVIGGQDLLEAAASGEDLPPRALLLTFDDGYSDHFTQVFPVLAREKLSACFFPSAKCVLENDILDVNKIHFILAAAPDKMELIETIFRLVDAHRPEFQLPSRDHYWEKVAVANRLDTREVVFIKHMLQRELPEEVRRAITDALFKKFVSADEKSFSRELYMDIEQLQHLSRQGMYIGSHGYNHSWLNRLEEKEQETEVRLSLEFLGRILGMAVDQWIMCYPHGAYSDSLWAILARQGCRIGLTTRIGIADLEQNHPLALPRLDTIDLPINRDAMPNPWTLQARERAAQARQESRL